MKTYLLVDGENIDATLGMSVLSRRPQPDERPRWDRVVQFVQVLAARDERADGDVLEEVKSLFFLNSTAQLPITFIQALLAMRFHPVPLSGDGKVVDQGIKKTITALLDRPTSRVVLASHDGDFIPEITALLRAGHKVAIICFREFLNGALAELEQDGLEIFDLELEVDAFTVMLPRVRQLTIDAFDPEMYL